MNKLAAFKFVASTVVGFGTATVTNSIIRNNTAPTNLFEQVTVGCAALVIGSMASSATKAHTDARIDEFVDSWSNAKSKDNTVTA